MNGKEKCEFLQNIRRMTAERNDIPYDFPACTHTGPCRGTCPKCEAELAYLNRRIEARRKTGKAVLAAVLSAGLLAMAGCVPTGKAAPGVSADPRPSPVEDLAGMIDPGPEETVLDGEIAPQQEPEEPQSAVSAAPEDETTLTGDVPYIPKEAE